VCWVAPKAISLVASCQVPMGGKDIVGDVAEMALVMRDAMPVMLCRPKCCCAEPSAVVTSGCGLVAGMSLHALSWFMSCF
jgi:hypothetical protein